MIVSWKRSESGGERRAWQRIAELETESCVACPSGCAKSNVAKEVPAPGSVHLKPESTY